MGEMRLLPQDVLVALKVALHDAPATNAQLAADLGLSGSQVHYAVDRCRAAGLLRRDELRVSAPNLLEFLVHGLKYAFPAEVGRIVRGRPTAHCAPPLRDELLQGDEMLVWPDPEGSERGMALEPIHKNVASIARRDAKMYAALALVDAIRVGRVRERLLAARHLEQLLSHATESNES